MERRGRGPDHQPEQARPRKLYAAGQKSEWLREEQLFIPGVEYHRRSAFLSDQLVLPPCYPGLRSDHGRAGASVAQAEREAQRGAHPDRDPQGYGSRPERNAGTAAGIAEGPARVRQDEGEADLTGDPRSALPDPVSQHARGRYV